MPQVTHFKVFVGVLILTNSLTFLYSNRPLITSCAQESTVGEDVTQTEGDSSPTAGHRVDADLLTSSQLKVKPVTGSPPCIKRQYHPSIWEKEWYNNISSLQVDSRQWPKGCEVMRARRRAMDQWLAFWKKRELSSGTESDWSNEVFSFHSIVDTCSGQTLAKLPLEPLVGFLRHPMYVCFQQALSYAENGRYQENKDYMLPIWVSEVFPQRRRALLYDLGASLYKSGFGGASQSWFVETYRHRGIAFDRIFGWEPIPHGAEEVFKEMPLYVFDAVSYYNVPANSSLTDKYNPLRTLKATARPEDLVVIKIDIDQGAIEEELIRQILTDASISSLIDELYFEHHVLLSPMTRRGWISRRDPKKQMTLKQTLSDSYRMFTRLRELGIRAHSWV